MLKPVVYFCDEVDSGRLADCIEDCQAACSLVKLIQMLAIATRKMLIHIYYITYRASEVRATITTRLEYGHSTS